MASRKKVASGPTRRELLAAVPPVMSASQIRGAANSPHSNIIMIISDQFRADCLGCLGLNPMNLTPNLDRMAARGTLFPSAYCNQPVCAPARGTIFTGQYPSRHGVWRNGIGLPETATTLATVLGEQGYSANYIGKWHLAPSEGTSGRGAVAPSHRGGFNGLWEGANALEWTSHAYEGELYGNDGQPIRFSGQYRTDFMTERAQRFLSSAKTPFLLTLSYLEVHHQNDTDTFDPPKDYAKRYPNPFIPQDLRPLPGSWPSQLADYFACVAKMDETVGTIRKTLADSGLDRNTILVFLSDHSCHFKTRNAEYKRSPHESSIHIPLIIEGPGFNRAARVPELVSQVDLSPTLLEAAGVAVPASMQGRSAMPLLDQHTAGWRNEVYFEMSEFVTGRGLRTPQYTYAVAAPKKPDWKAVASAPQYVEYILYDLAADPYQHVNLAGRAEYRTIAADLRRRLLERIREASGETPTIDPCWFPYS
jgi:arylsulfatase A-like enzyme